LVSKYSFIEQELADIRSNNTHRAMRSVSLGGTQAKVDNKDAVLLCSNDYLGLSQHKRVLSQTVRALKQISQCSSRLIAGNTREVTDLEKKLAEHHNTESALVYPSGYMANLGAITAISGEGSTVFSDELNHRSIIDACKLSGAKVKIFPHNDDESLAKMMSRIPGRKIVVTEGLFSIDGDMANLKKICELAKEQNALVVVDDAHGDFVFGSTGSYSGVSTHLGVDDLVDIHVSSLSKALGCFGGYVATTSILKEFLVNKSPQFIFTSALPSHICASALAAIPLALEGGLQRQLFKNVRYFSHRLVKRGFLQSTSCSQIIPIWIGDEKTALSFSNELLDCGAFVHPIRYPTVKKGSSRLRVTLSSSHTISELDHSIDSLETVGKKYHIV